MVEPPRIDEGRQGFGRAVDDFGNFARGRSKRIVAQTGDFRDAAANSFENLTAKKLDPYEEAIAAYNGAFTAMNDTGVSLLRQRERSTDLI